MVLTIDEKYQDKPEKLQWLNSACGELLRQVYTCYHESTSLIKGIDCLDIMKEYHQCCRANENACSPAISAIEDSGAEEIDFEEGEEEQIFLRN